jgi:hypothetical protein
VVKIDFLNPCKTAMFSLVDIRNAYIAAAESRPLRFSLQFLIDRYDPQGFSFKFHVINGRLADCTVNCIRCEDYEPFVINEQAAYNQAVAFIQLKGYTGYPLDVQIPRCVDVEYMNNLTDPEYTAPLTAQIERLIRVTNRIKTMGRRDQIDRVDLTALNIKAHLLSELNHLVHVPLHLVADIIKTDTSDDVFLVGNSGLHGASDTYVIRNRRSQKYRVNRFILQLYLDGDMYDIEVPALEAEELRQLPNYLNFGLLTEFIAGFEREITRIQNAM